MLCLTVRPRSSRAHCPRPAPVNDANSSTVGTQSAPILAHALQSDAVMAGDRRKAREAKRRLRSTTRRGLFNAESAQSLDQCGIVVQSHLWECEKVVNFCDQVPPEAIEEVRGHALVERAEWQERSRAKTQVLTPRMIVKRSLKMGFNLETAVDA